MREHADFTCEEYELMKVALERSDVPVEAVALVSTWIEGEGLLVQIRKDSPDTQFVPVLEARSKAVEEIKKQLGNDLGDDQE